MMEFPIPDLTAPIFEVTKSCGFEAAHRLPETVEGSINRRLHGHSFRVEATVRGRAAPPVGWVEDLGELEAELRALCDRLDHSLLNEHEGLESPTLEAICLFLARRLAPAFPSLCAVTVSRPSLGERCRLQLEPKL